MSSLLARHQGEEGCGHSTTSKALLAGLPTDCTGQSWDLARVPADLRGTQIVAAAMGIAVEAALDQRTCSDSCQTGDVLNWAGGTPLYWE